MADPVEIRSPPTRVTLPNMVVLMPNGTSVGLITEIRQKFLTLRDTDRSATYDFLLVTRGNHGPTSYRHEGRLRSKVANFSQPQCILNAPLRGFPLEFFCNCAWG